MPQSTGKDFSLFAARFREERERLGFSQPELGKLLGADKKTLYNWEKGKSVPDSADLAMFHAIGGDVLYILTGSRTVPEGMEQGREGYELSPGRRLAIKLAIMHLSEDDADLLLAMARRLAGEKT